MINGVLNGTKLVGSAQPHVPVPLLELTCNQVLEHGRNKAWVHPTWAGPLVTAGGLTFIAAGQDNFLRAFETSTGRLVWQARLPAGGQAGPMTYEHQGRQYVAITATGHARFETKEGDYLKVFALNPDSPDLTGVPPGQGAQGGGTDPDEEAP